MNFAALDGVSDIILEGVEFRPSYTMDNQDSTKTYSYDADDFGSALFLYTEEDGYPEIDGNFLFDGSEYRIENCGEGCHLLVKLSEQMVNPEPDDEIEASDEEERSLDEAFRKFEVSMRIFHFCQGVD